MFYFDMGLKKQIERIFDRFIVFKTLLQISFLILLFSDSWVASNKGKKTQLKKDVKYKYFDKEKFDLFNPFILFEIFFMRKY